MAAFFGIPAMIIMMIFMMIWKDHMTAPQIFTGLSLENLIMFLLSTPVQVGENEFYKEKSYCILCYLVD